MKTIYDLIVDCLREKAKKTLKEAYGKCTEFESQYFMSLNMDDVEKVVYKIACEYNDGWTLTSRRLPEEPKNDEDLTKYIVMIEGAEKATTLFYAGDGHWYEDGTFYKVTMWQSFPEPPDAKRYTWDHGKRLQEISQWISDRHKKEDENKDEAIL